MSRFTGRSRSRSEENLAAFGGDLTDKNDASSGRGLLKRTEPRREDAIWTYDTDLPQTEAEDPSEPIDNSNPAEKLKLKAEDGILISYDAETRVWNRKKVYVIIDSRAFDEGAIRRAFKMQILEWPDRKFVCKFSKNPLEKAESYKADVEMQSVCKRWGELFNTFKPPKLAAFCDAWLLELPKRKRGNIASVEEFMEGQFVKYSNNRGGVLIPRNTPGAFTHFTYEKSGGTVMIVDIQGCGDYYTDPQVHTNPRKGFGQGNLGSQGIDWFLNGHKCNQVCQLLGLPPTVNTSSVPISPADYARAMNQGTFPWPGDVRSRLGPNSGVHLSVTKKKGIPPPQPRLVDSQPAKPMLTLTVFDKLDLSKPAHTFRLKPGTYGIGRIAKNPVHIPFLCLSRQHASITFGEDGSLKVRDLGSTNKTRRSKNKEDFEVTKPFAANADEVVQNGEWLNFGGDIKSQFSVHIPKEGEAAVDVAVEDGPVEPSKYSKKSPPKFKELGKSRSHKVEVTAMALFGRRLFTGDGDGNVKVWDAESLKEIGGRKAHAKATTGLCGVAGGLLSVGMDAKLNLWEIDEDGFMKQKASKSVHETDCRTLAAASDQLVFTGGSDKDIRAWKAVDGDFELLYDLLGHEGHCRHLKLSGNILISGGQDGTVKLWNLDARVCIFDLTTHTHYFFIKSLAFTGRYTISSDDNKVWKIFDTWTLQEVWSMKERGSSVDCVGIHKDFFLLADEAQVRVASWEGPRILTTIPGAKDVEHIHFSDDGSRMYTGHGTGVVMLWEFA